MTNKRTPKQIAETNAFNMALGALVMRYGVLRLSIKANKAKGGITAEEAVAMRAIGAGMRNLLYDRFDALEHYDPDDSADEVNLLVELGMWLEGWEPFPLKS